MNTQYVSNVPNVPLGMSTDGTFRLVKHLEQIPPKETEFRLKRVFFDSSGDAFQGGRNKTPTIWLSLEFPQMESLLHTPIDKETINDGEHTSVFGGPNNVDKNVINDFGILKFPVMTFPVQGSQVNVHNRQQNTSLGELYEHKSNHNMDIPLGRMNIENGFIELILTPRDFEGFMSIQKKGLVRLNRIRQIQVILEYN